ncbi:hypothetical protein ACTVCO_07395 [Sanguibacter sp. A247]|uniref:hypothetical protein n=1 Tax=Sanguibacter sp. A247 TaxID=3457327 RepID=UPI003FD786A7
MHKPRGHHAVSAVGLPAGVPQGEGDCGAIDTAVPEDSAVVRPSAPGVAPAAEPTDDELDARARVVLGSMPALDELLAERVPLTLIVDLVSPFGPDSERIARDERDA